MTLREVGPPLRNAIEDYKDLCLNGTSPKNMIYRVIHLYINHREGIEDHNLVHLFTVFKAEALLYQQAFCDRGGLLEEAQLNIIEENRNKIGKPFLALRDALVKGDVSLDDKLDEFLVWQETYNSARLVYRRQYEKLIALIEKGYEL